MKLTILKTGHPPRSLAGRFPSYPDMFRAMFARAGVDMDCEEIDVAGGAALPDPQSLDAVLITGSPAGVYEDHIWLDPLRAFIRDVYEQRTRLVGICFGHQVIADALGGEVRKSEKGWGLGRHTYRIVERPAGLDLAGTEISLACSHQDQVITPPAEAHVLLASDFTPNAALFYDNGATLSFQAHPEFEDDYATALIELRRGIAPDAVIEAALATMAKPSDSLAVAHAIAAFIKG